MALSLDVAEVARLRVYLVHTYADFTFMFFEVYSMCIHTMYTSFMMGTITTVLYLVLLSCFAEVFFHSGVIGPSLL